MQITRHRFEIQTNDAFFVYIACILDNVWYHLHKRSEMEVKYMNAWKTRSFRITALVLFLIGLALEIWQSSVQGTLGLNSVFLSDLLFAEFMVFMIFGLIRLLGNMRAFTAASYSFTFVHRLFRNEKTVYKNAQDAKDDYYNYRESKPVHEDAKNYLFLAGLFLLLSLVLAFAV